MPLYQMLFYKNLTVTQFLMLVTNKISMNYKVFSLIFFPQIILKNKKATAVRSRESEQNIESKKAAAVLKRVGDSVTNGHCVNVVGGCKYLPIGKGIFQRTVLPLNLVYDL